MPEQITRRETLKKGLAAASLLTLWSDRSSRGMAQPAGDVSFTDIPANFTTFNPKTSSRLLDIRKIDGPVTPVGEYFAVQHFDQPAINDATYRLKLTGLVKKPMELSLDELRNMHPVEITVAYECSGNTAHSMQGLVSCGRFTGVPLRSLLKRAGIGAKAREVVFFGADHGSQDVVFRKQTFNLDQPYGRSVTLENALKPEPLVAYALDGEPLRREQGFPVRLIMPGWYGMANVKWLRQVRLQEDRFLGNFQARWYRSVVGEGGTGAENDPTPQWIETEITRMRLKSVIARLSKTGSAFEISGYALNDGTPIKSVEIQIDGGPWQKASFASTNSKYSWKLFSYRWEGATRGEHTVVSRATDAEGNVQPVAADLARKKTFLQDNAQFPRKILIS